MLNSFPKTGGTSWMQPKAGDLFKITYEMAQHHNWPRNYIIGIFERIEPYGIICPFAILLDGSILALDGSSLTGKPKLSIGLNGTFVKLSAKDYREISVALMYSHLVYNLKRKELKHKPSNSIIARYSQNKNNTYPDANDTNSI